MEDSMSTDPKTASIPQGIWDTEVASLPETAADWLLPGFIARHNMTLTTMWKAGKTCSPDAPCLKSAEECNNKEGRKAGKVKFR
jgi:hypothetical protein